MAAVAKARKPELISPPKEAIFTYGDLGEDVAAGDQLVKNAQNRWVRAPITANEAQGMAPKDGRNGELSFDILKVGKMDGFLNLTPGDPLYPSGATPGGLDTTAKTVATTPPVPYPARVRADSPSAVFVNYV